MASRPSYDPYPELSYYGRATIGSLCVSYQNNLILYYFERDSGKNINLLY